jgi:hypothetical protein
MEEFVFRKGAKKRYTLLSFPLRSLRLADQLWFKAVNPVPWHLDFHRPVFSFARQIAAEIKNNSGSLAALRMNPAKR